MRSSQLRTAGLALLVVSVFTPLQRATAQLVVSPEIASFADEDGDVGLTMRTPVAAGPGEAVVLLGAGRDGLFVLSRDLQSVRRVGRIGSGPGEYRYISSFGWLADTLWVTDSRTHNVTYFEKVGRGQVRAKRFMGIATSRTFTTQPMAITPNGLAICGVLPASGSAMLSAALEPFLRVPLAAALRPDTLFSVNVQNLVHEKQIQDTKLTGKQLMSDATLWALSRNGEFAATLDRSDHDAQRRKPPLLTVMRTDGRLIYRVSLPHPMQRVSSSDVDAVVARKVRSFNTALGARPGPRLTPSTYKQGIFVPHYRVPIGDMVLGDDGTVILRGNDWTTPAVTHTWLTPDGRVRGTFSLPREQVVRTVVGQHIWSLVESAIGEVRLVKQAIK